MENQVTLMPLLALTDWPVSSFHCMRSSPLSRARKVNSI